MKATILLPTTSDRGPLLQYSAGSALRQTVQDIELFIVGDGVNETTRQAANALVQQDKRVNFFDFPKHPRRGETYRHEVLQSEAKGEIVCYLCDRDLMLSNHIAELYEALNISDIASSFCYSIRATGEITLAHVDFIGEWKDHNTKLRRLSCIAHTLEAYKSLPYGWRTTPPNQFTDHYMWRQFLEQNEIRANMIPVPTVLYFNRRPHPGSWSTERRREELANWYATLVSEGGESRIHRDCLYHIVQNLVDFRRDLLKQQKEKERSHSSLHLLRRTTGRIRRLVSGFCDRKC
jgi:glycosyltransferase involved in cell wall biosynthesis